MIPEFPNFKALEVTDQCDIASFTDQAEPYSDFTFTSLWCWDVGHTVALSRLNGNLVIRFKEYEGDAHFYSFFGTHALVVTATTLLSFARQHGMEARLRLVPEFVATNGGLLRAALDVAEDPANFDYILSIEDVAALRGGKYVMQRNHVNHFIRTYAADVRLIDMDDPRIQQEMIAVCLHWAHEKDVTALPETHFELAAVQRLFAAGQRENLIAFAVFDADVMRGFAVYEGLHCGYAILHFEKTDRTYRGISPYLRQQACDYLHKHGYLLLNIEQDLGIPALTFAKQSWRPCRMLKKYSLSEKGVN